MTYPNTKFLVDSDGYILVYLPNHQRAQRSAGYQGFVLEHLVVAETLLNRPLRANEHVHHFNQVKHHNAPTNLLVLLGHQHSKLHHWLERVGIANERPSLHYSSDPKYVQKALKRTHRCQICKYPIRKALNYCSPRCARFGSRRTSRPGKNQLVDDIAEYGYQAVADMHDVSYNAVRKWVRAYGIDPKSLSGRRP